MTSQPINVIVSQAYLELARSYVAATASSKVRDITDPNSPDQSNRATTTFGFAALSTIFSYAAIEAFVNHGLYLIWEDARHAHKVIDEIQRSDLSRRYIPIYTDFYKKYGRFFPFKTLKSTDLRELTERIKTICKARNLPSLPQTKTKLWENLLRLEQTRHDLIHPAPEQTKFNELIERLFSTEPHHLYPQTASDIIRFFFQSTNSQPPDYLDNNQLFRINTIEFL